MPQTLAITTQAVRNELSGSGMAVYLLALGDTTAQDAVIDERIGEAQAYIENTLRIYLFQEVIKSRPLDPGLVRIADGVGDYTKLDDSYPFILKDWQGYGRIWTHRKPIVSVQRVAVRYGQQGDVLSAVTYPQNWISFEARLGRISVEAILGSATYGAGALILLPVTGGAIKRDALPNIVTVDYTAGYLPQDFDRDSDDPYDASPDYDVRELLRAVRLQATLAMLQAMDRALGAGGGSISMYGLSESYNAGRFAQEMERYRSQVDDIVLRYQMAESGPLIGVL